MLAIEDKDRFGYASESVKQILALSSGVLTISIVFSKDLLAKVKGGDLTMLKWSWALLIASSILGVLALFGMTTELTRSSPDVTGAKVTIPVMLQFLTFVAGMVLLALVGILAL